MPVGKRHGKQSDLVTSGSSRPSLRPTTHAAHHMEAQTDPPPDNGIQAGSAAFDALMLAITTCQAALTTKIEHVQTETALPGP